MMLPKFLTAYHVEIFSINLDKRCLIDFSKFYIDTSDKIKNTDPFLQ